MKNKVYSFVPKGQGYNIYVTKTDYSDGSKKRKSSSSEGISDILIDYAAKGIVRAIFGKKK